VREEMNAIDGQEIVMPVVQPAELWQQSGRWEQIGGDMARLKDRNGRDLCLAMTHEEVVTWLSSGVVRSYRQLPFMLYQIQTKFRDEPRPRGGLIRVREFTMKDGYSFHIDFDNLDAYYPHVYQAYFNIFRRCGIDVVAVSSDTGMMGGTDAHEFMALVPDGEDTLLLCSACGYRANRQVAKFRKTPPETADVLPAEEVHTPGTTTIDEVAAFLGVLPAQTAKAVFMVATVEKDGVQHEQFVFAVLRGDMELNETKLSNAVKALKLRPAVAEEIRDIGAEPGFGSAIGIDRKRALLIVDDLIPGSINLVAGANRPDYHLRNVNYGRDYTADLVTDIAAASDGHGCPSCGTAMRTARGIEVGNIFKLGTKYSQSMDARFLDEQNASKPMVMGCYGIGVDRLMATVLERHHDEHGIRWPASIAPFAVSLVSLSGGDANVLEAAEHVYRRLTEAGVETLYDDRDERAGVKFNDADLMGMPIRLTVGGRGVKNGVVEMKNRRTGEMREIPLGDGLEDAVHREIEAEYTEIRKTVTKETFRDG
ncbi:MAG: proline--tRNA ligase, partial [candidate division Zixibacteria bacterium]|nr:proline--tRNA ligase [candidate division Zixibacteria bacterium]